MVALVGATAPIAAHSAIGAHGTAVASIVEPGGRTLVFRDRFDGGTLAADKWVPCYPWWSGAGCEHLVNNELQWYVPSGDVMAGERLEMTATKERILGEDEEGNPLWYDYASGMATTAGRFEFTYGYVEFDARVPKGQGMWPALWMLSVKCCAPEIDIMENLGDRPKKMYFTYHPDYVEPQQGTSVRGVARGWHTYAIDWQPGSVTWYLDGDQVFQIDEAPTKPMYLLMNLAVGGDWPGPPDGTTEFPASFDVRSVRVWQ